VGFCGLARVFIFFFMDFHQLLHKTVVRVFTDPPLPRVYDPLAEVRDRWREFFGDGAEIDGAILG
jgi:hypothetical protein